MPTHPRLSLIEPFKDLPDPRVHGRCEHELLDLLIIATCTLLCGGTGFDDMADFGRAKQEWFKTFLPLRNGIPSHDTFNRLFAALKPAAFLDCFLNWTQSLRQTVAQEIVALDGKALRRAQSRGKSPRYLVSAWAQSNGLVLGPLKVADKSNEITALPQLLRVLELVPGCANGRRPKPGAHRPRRREPGHPAPPGLEPTQTGPHQKAGAQRKTTQCGLGSCLPAPIIGFLMRPPWAWNALPLRRSGGCAPNTQPL